MVNIKSIIKRGLLCPLFILTASVVFAAEVSVSAVNVLNVNPERGTVDRGNFVLEYNKTETITATPEPGYSVFNITVSPLEALVKSTSNTATVKGLPKNTPINVAVSFAPEQHKVKFDSNGGKIVSGELLSQYTNSVTQSPQKYTDFPKVEREGYTFDGWYYGDKLIEEGDTVWLVEDATFVAHWKAISYNLNLVPTTGITEFYYQIGTADAVRCTGKVSVPVLFGTEYEWYAVAAEGYSTEYTLSNPKRGTMGVDGALFDVKATAKKFTVYFNAGSEATCATESKEVTYYQTYGTLPTPTSPGKSFKYWKTPGGSVVSADVTVKLTENITLEAVWDAEKFEVAKNAVNGSVSVNKTKPSFGETLEITWSPGRESGYTYEFIGTTIYAGGDNTGIVLQQYTSGSGAFFELKNYVETIYIEAKYSKTAKTYKVTLDPNEGKCTQSEWTVTYNQKYGTLPTATRTGYDFDGWSTTKYDSSRVSDEDIYTRDGESTLYARWIAKIYAVSTESENCSVAVTTNGIATTRGYYDKSLRIDWTLDQCEGYDITLKSAAVLDSDNPSGEPLKKFTYEGSFLMKDLGEFYPRVMIQVLADKVAKKYSLYFNPNGGEPYSLSSKEVTYDQKYDSLPEVTRSGYDFLGWTLPSSETVTSNSVVKITESKTLTAQWKPKSFTIAFDSNSGDSITNTVTVVYNGEYGSLPAATRTGHSFIGWFTDRENGNKITESSTVSILADQMLYAHWTANKYTVEFDANGERGSMDAIECEYDKSFTLPKVAFTSFQRTFLGWSDDKDDAEPKWKDMAVPGNLAESGTITLYAIWRDDRNDITIAAHAENCLLETSFPNMFTYTRANGVNCKGSNGTMTCEVSGPGVLSFCWKTANPMWFSIDVDETVDVCDLHDKVLSGHEADMNCLIGTALSDGWVRVNRTFTSEGPHKIVWHVWVATVEMYIDRVVWTPAGDNPEPTEEDIPSIASDFTFEADSRFDYVILKKDSLTDENWQELEAVVEDGKVKLPMFEGKQGFFKIKVIQLGTK